MKRLAYEFRGSPPMEPAHGQTGSARKAEAQEPFGIDSDFRVGSRSTELSIIVLCSLSKNELILSQCYFILF